VAEVRQRREKIVKAAGPLRDLQKMADELPVLRAQSFVNYSAAPVGGQVYDSAWLANNTGAM